MAELRGHTRLLVRAEPQPVALAVLRPRGRPAQVSIVDGGLRVDAGPDRAAELVRALVRAEVDVLEVHPQERTLEDAFFALTGSDAQMARWHDEGSLRAELRRMLRWPTMWVLGGTWLVLNLTFGYVFTYLTYRSDDGTGFAGGAPRSRSAGAR